MFLARVEWLPVTSRSHGQTDVTDKCKISIMILADLENIAVTQRRLVTTFSINTCLP